MTRRTAVVIGGGISGLAAAWELSSEPDVEVTVYEAADRFGGLIHSSEFAGRELDEGADAFLRRVPEAAALYDEIGAPDPLISPATGAALIYANGGPRPIPGGLVLGVPARFDELAVADILTSDGLARAQEEPSRPWEPVRNDIALGALIDDRYGTEVTRRLVEPLIGGIYAGNLDELSLDAVMPALAEHARGEAALTSALAQQLSSTASGPVFGAPPSSMGSFIGLICDALTTRGVTLRTNTRCTEIPAADEVVIATPASHAASLLTTRSPRAAESIASIPTAGVVLVSLAIPNDSIADIDTASGLLVPRDAGRFITAASYATTKWPHLRRDDDRAILRVSSGHSRDARALEMDDDEIVAAMMRDLADIAGCTGSPSEVRVSRYPHGFPQYLVGHAALIDTIDATLADDAPSIAWCGASTRGPGIPACIRSGRRAARVLRGRRT